MKIVTASIAALWLCLSFAASAQGTTEFRGSWTLSPSRDVGKVQFNLTQRNADGGTSRQQSAWPVTAFNVLDLKAGGKHEVTFVIEHEVGRIECRGFIEDGEGAGAFTFKLSAQYLESLRSRSHVEVDESEQFAQALRTLSIAAETTIRS